MPGPLCVRGLHEWALSAGGKAVCCKCGEKRD
jgi:hypothetical protein